MYFNRSTCLFCKPAHYMTSIAYHVARFATFVETDILLSLGNVFVSNTRFERNASDEIR